MDKRQLVQRVPTWSTPPVKCSNVVEDKLCFLIFYHLCRSTRNWQKAHFMKRCPQPATLKTTSATPWRMASFTLRTPSTTCVWPRVWLRVINIKSVSVYTITEECFCVIYRHGLHIILSWQVIRFTTQRRHLITSQLMKKRPMKERR